MTNFEEICSCFQKFYYLNKISRRILYNFYSRGSDIRGLVDNEEGSDHLPYTILSYANGYGFDKHLKAVEGTGWTSQNGKFY